MEVCQCAGLLAYKSAISPTLDLCYAVLVSYFVARTNRACDKTQARFKFSPPETCVYPSSTSPPLPVTDPFQISTFYPHVYFFPLCLSSITVVYGMCYECQASTAQRGKAVKIIGSTYMDV